ncbi:MAG TPA: hypothetical protein PLQ04_06590 [Lachnospiraceae bacterium]|nr:hypothetical protein [Lachnospiraceae bacterium]
MRFLERITYMMVIFGLIAVFAGGKDAIDLMKAPVDLYETDWDDLEYGMHVTGEIELVWDMVITETSTINGVERESARYYAIPLLTEDKDSIMVDQLIAVRVNTKADYNTMEEILDETNDWWFDETGTVDYGMTSLPIEGVLHKMDDEEESYMREYAESCLIDPSDDVEDYYVPFVLEKMNKSRVIGLVAVGLILIVVGVILFIFTRKKIKEKESNMIYRPTTNPNVQRDYYAGDAANIYQPDAAYTNTTMPVYDSGSSNGSTAPQMWGTDPNTGLSQEFLQRSAQENQPQSVEPQMDMGSNPLYGTRPDGDK